MENLDKFHKAHRLDVAPYVCIWYNIGMKTTDTSASIPTSMTLTKITTYIKQSQHMALKDMARTGDIPFSELIRRAIDAYLERKSR